MSVFLPTFARHIELASVFGFYIAPENSKNTINHCIRFSTYVTLISTVPLIVIIQNNTFVSSSSTDSSFSQIKFGSENLNHPVNFFAALYCLCALSGTPSQGAMFSRNNRLFDRMYSFLHSTIGSSMASFTIFGLD